MADWNKPTLSTAYATFITEMRNRDVDLAMQFDPDYGAAPTNLPGRTIRWRSSASKWEVWNGTAWGDLAALYAINISGTAANVTGVVAAAKGGTGQSSYAVGDLLYASGATALSKLAGVATGNVLLSGGVATAPSWGKVGLTTHVSGVLPVANGGTGGTLPVSNGGTGATNLTGFLYGNGTDPISAATAAQLATLGFASGTRMPFAMAYAPSGWTQDLTDNANNRMLRVVNTTGNGVGGFHSPILNNVVPAHTHGFTTGTVSSDHAHSGTTGTQSANHTHGVPYSPGNYSGSSGFGSMSFANGGNATTTGISENHTHSITTGGISANHTHSGTTDNGSSQTNWAPRYIDMIICKKD